MRVQPGRSSSGFTLIEMVISGAVAALIISAAYMCLNAAIAGQKLIEPRAEVIQKARVTMAMVAADLRTACPLSKDYEFLGMARVIGTLQADNLDFATHNYIPKREGEGDYCQTSYFVEKEKGTGDLSLYRRRNPVIAIDALAGGSRELIARGLRGIRFEYFDGYDWYESWGETDPKKKDRKTVEFAPNLTGMPEAVRITTWFNPNPKKKPRADTQSLTATTTTTDEEEIPSEPPMVFQTVARLNLAAASQSGFSTDSTGQSGNNSGGNNNNGNAQPNGVPGVNQ
jgi:prepilin-type N-terminal cleavage/methylation domain-containing protein